jgi:galactose mutarotase-like enzyme
MVHTLENSDVKINVKLAGAELCNFFDKKNEVEHLWQADSNVWSRHAPILFPLVGQVEDGVFSVDSQTYKMGQHGFARDNDFKLIIEEKNTLIFELRSTKKIKELYPYKFSLRVIYILAESKLTITYSVENIDSKEMFFNLGAHPGFAVPFEKEHSFSDYYLEFSEKETLDRILLDTGGLVSGKKTVNYLQNESTIKLNDSLFDDDALVFKGVKSDFVSIKSHKTNRVLRFGLGSFPFLGIWSKPKANAPFVCIEPWYGHTAVRGTNKELNQRVAVSSLMPSEVLEDSFSIELA